MGDEGATEGDGSGTAVAGKWGRDKGADVDGTGPRRRNGGREGGTKRGGRARGDGGYGGGWGRHPSSSARQAVR